MITMDAIEMAKREGVPFSIYMADGREYQVESPEQIHAQKGRGYLIYIGGDFVPRMLLYLTMIAVNYLEKNA